MVTALAPAETAALYRRSVQLAAVLGGVALVVFSLLGHPLAGVFAVVGLALGAVNGRFVLSSILRFATDGTITSKRPLVLSTLRRLGLVTVVALVFMLAFGRDGAAVVLGLAVFQTLVLGRASAALLREVSGA